MYVAGNASGCIIINHESLTFTTLNVLCDCTSANFITSPYRGSSALTELCMGVVFVSFFLFMVLVFLFFIYSVMVQAPHLGCVSLYHSF